VSELLGVQTNWPPFDSSSSVWVLRTAVMCDRFLKSTILRKSSFDCRSDGAISTANWPCASRCQIRQAMPVLLPTCRLASNRMNGSSERSSATCQGVWVADHALEQKGGVLADREQEVLKLLVDHRSAASDGVSA
jgi:hypothetical protein